jgi:hypothetical protein
MPPLHDGDRLPVLLNERRILLTQIGRDFVHAWTDDTVVYALPLSAVFAKLIACEACIQVVRDE